MRPVLYAVQILIKVVDGGGQELELLVEQAQLLAVFLPLVQRLDLQLHTFEQFFQINRLLVVIGDARPKGLDDVFFLGLAGQHDGLEQMRLAASHLHRFDHLDPVHAGHFQIAKHDTDGAVGAETLNGLKARIATHTLIAAALQKFAEFFNNRGLVIDHQNFGERVVIHRQLHAVRGRRRRPDPFSKT